MKRALLLLILIAPIPVAAGNLFPTECGDLRRENHNVNPSPLQNPIQVQWMTSPNLNLGVPCSNPVVLSDRVVQAFWQGMRCYDRTTGKILWTWVCNSYTNLWNAPAYDADRNLLYQGCNNGDTVALDPQTGNVVWVFNHDPNSITNQIATPLYVNGLLYVGNGGSAFLCLNPDTRAVVWSFNFSSYFGKPFNDATLTPAYDNGSIYLATENGHLFSLNGTTGAVQWYVKQNLIHQNCPLLSDEYIYVLGNLSQVECRSRTDGSLVWTTDTHVCVGITNGCLALCGDILVVPGDSWRVWGLNRYNGAMVWCTTLTGNFARNSPLVVCGKVYISACHGDYYCLDR